MNRRMTALVRLALLATVAGIWLALPGSAFAGLNTWTTNGPTNGNVHALAVSPGYVTDHTLFAGGDFFGAAGIFKSTTIAPSWTFAITGLPPEANVNALAISPAYATDHTVYAGTDWGVYKSTTGGDSWAEDDAGFPTGGNLNSYAVESIAISPDYATDHTVFAGGNFFGAAGIFKSTSVETSWTFAITGLPPEANVNALAISPAYATDLRVFAGTDLGVYKSASGGASWSARNDGLAVPVTAVFSLAISPAFATDHTLFAGSSEGNGVYAYTIDEYVVTPIEGTNRIATAIAASAEAFPGGAGTVVIATGFNWPDALGGAALAGALDGPILLTSTAALPAEVMTEIRRLGAGEAYILGGPSAVSTAVENALKAELGDGNVTRLAGANRYSTARAIAAKTVDILEAAGGYDGTCFIATGANFPDALGASPLAAAKGWPIYLVNPAVALDTATKSAMASDGVQYPIILGFTAAIPAGIETALNGIYGAADVERLFGTNRYSTAVAVATYGVEHAGLGWDKLALATGTNFPDALAGGVLQGKDGSVMLLTPGTTLNGSVRTVLTANKATIDEVRYLGGTSAISSAVRTAVANALE